MFEDATRVPLIISGPGVTTTNEVVKAPVELVDLYPTIMDVADLKPPSFVSGKSLVPYFTNSKAAVRSSALTELQVNIGNKKAQGYGIQTKRYRLNQWRFKGVYSYELYDHKFDKSELKNLADKPECSSIKDSLLTVLESRIAEANRVPLGLGKQINGAMPTFEPKRFFSQPK